MQAYWRWHPRIEPVIVLKGVAFKDLVGEEVRIYITINGGPKVEVEAVGPDYISGRTNGAQFVRHPQVESFFYYALEPVKMFGKDDLALIEYDEGGRNVTGYPEYEIRRVLMG